MAESIAPRRVRVVANDHQAFGICWHVADFEWRALVAAKFGVIFGILAFSANAGLAIFIL